MYWPWRRIVETGSTELIAHWGRVKEQLINASHTVEYSLRMGILQPYDILVLPALLQWFFAALSKNKLRDRRGSTLELANALNENRIDFALCSLPHEKHFAYEELFQEELCCITSLKPINHQWASRPWREPSLSFQVWLSSSHKIESYLDNQVPSIHWSLSAISVRFLTWSNELDTAVWSLVPSLSKLMLE